MGRALSMASEQPRCIATIKHQASWRPYELLTSARIDLVYHGSQHKYETRYCNRDRITPSQSSSALTEVAALTPNTPKSYTNCLCGIEHLFVDKTVVEHCVGRVDRGCGGAGRPSVHPGTRVRAGTLATVTTVGGSATQEIQEKSWGLYSRGSRIRRRH